MIHEDEHMDRDYHTAASIDGLSKQLAEHYEAMHKITKHLATIQTYFGWLLVITGFIAAILYK